MWSAQTCDNRSLTYTDKDTEAGPAQDCMQGNLRIHLNTTPSIVPLKHCAIEILQPSNSQYLTSLQGQRVRQLAYPTAGA